MTAGYLNWRCGMPALCPRAEEAYEIGQADADTGNTGSALPHNCPDCRAAYLAGAQSVIDALPNTLDGAQ